MYKKSIFIIVIVAACVGIYGYPLHSQETACPSNGPYKFFWGNLHSHTSYSDGVETPAYAFDYARDPLCGGIDFLAVTDHSHMLDPEEFADILNQAKDVADGGKNEDGEFVAIAGQEWSGYDPVTGLYNHVVVLNANDVFTGCRDRLDAFYEQLLTSGNTANFCHPYNGCFNGFDFSAEGDLGVNSVEVRREKERLRYVELLNSGWHVGVDGSTDDHQATWGNRGCWTVALAPDLTKEYILEAVKNHRTYSTWDRDLQLTFKAEDHWMGETFDHHDNIKFYISVCDPTGDPVKNIVLCQNSLCSDFVLPSTSSVYTWEPEITPRSGMNYYYVLVCQGDCELKDQWTYSSPIWINCTTHLPSTPVPCFPPSKRMVAPHNTPVSSLTPTFVWLPSTNADKYELQYSTSQDFPLDDGTTVTVPNITETFYTPDQDLENGKVYYWRVKATNEFGHSKYSLTRWFQVVAERDRHHMTCLYSSRFMVPFADCGVSLGYEPMVWFHPRYGDIHPCGASTVILGTDARNLSLEYDNLGLEVQEGQGWTAESSHFDHWSDPEGDPVTYTFERHHASFKHPTLSLQIEVFAVGVFDPEGGPCGDAVFANYVIHNTGEEPIDNIQKALYLEMNVPPCNPSYNAVDGVEEFASLWAYEIYRPNILFGMTRIPVWLDKDWPQKLFPDRPQFPGELNRVLSYFMRCYGGDRACGGRGVSLPKEIWPGGSVCHLWEVMQENPWDVDPYGDQPTGVGLMLTDQPFSLAPSKSYYSGHILWAFDKDDPVDGLTLKNFLYKLMQLQGYYRGDLNSDGKCNEKDVDWLSKHLNRPPPPEGPLPLDERADLNGDGSVTIEDLKYLRAYLWGLLQPPPVDKNRFLPAEHTSPKRDIVNYQDMFKRPGLVHHPVWGKLPDLVTP